MAATSFFFEIVSTVVCFCSVVPLSFLINSENISTGNDASRIMNRIVNLDFSIFLIFKGLMNLTT